MANTPNIIEKLEALARAPKDWRVTTLYTCGKVRTHDAQSEAAANNYATGERRKIGKNLIDRDTNQIVRIDSVTVARKPEAQS